MKNLRHSALVLAAICGAAVPSIAATTAAPSALGETAKVASAQWSDIKDHSHEMRTEFFAGLRRLELKLDAQIRGLAAKRATMKGITGTREWDIAMKELESAQSYLRAVGAAIHEASRETWDQEKDKVGRAWVNTQDAYGKVKSSTTS